MKYEYVFRAKIIPKSSQIQPKSVLAESWRCLGGILGGSWRPCRSETPIFRDFGGAWGPTWLPAGSPKRHPKRELRHFCWAFVTHIKLKRFFIACGFHFGRYRSLKSWCFVKDILQKSIKQLFRKKIALEGVLGFPFGSQI